MGEAEPANSRRIWPTLWREKYVILASIIVMLGLALAYTLTAAKVYQASAIIQVNLSTSNPGTSDTTAANQALAENYAALLVSPGFLSTVRPQVDNGKLSTSALQGRLSATALQQGALVQLDATGPSPHSAQTINQQVINGFLASLQTAAAQRTAQLQSELQAQITSLSTQISTLSTPPITPTSAEKISGLKASRAALIGQNATLVANGIAQGTSATLSAPPVAASAPISPRHSLDLLGGALLGIVLGVGLAWARASLRPAIHSAEDVSALVELPLLASIPLKTRYSYKSDDPSLAESYRVLQANLMFALRARGAQVVTVAGFNPRVGKTSTVEGLARALSRGDRQVVLVDGDMRAATLSERLKYPNHPGIVDVLQGRLTLDEALVQLDEGLWLLPSVPSRTNAATLLSGSGTFSLMAELRERFDVVLIDSPPLSGLADGLILGSHSDVVVLVVRAGVTRPRDLARISNGQLHNMTPILGIVVFEELPMEPYYTGSHTPSKTEPGPASVPS
jgi:capsular exopolysaccharide synthesis family protein